MLGLFSGLFIALHGLVHVWYIILSQRLVAQQPGQPAFSWTGTSWLVTNLFGDLPARWIASLLFVVATAGFVAGGTATILHGEWSRPALIASALLSSATLLLFWDGGTDLLIEKGLIGVVINIGILAAVVVS